MDIFIASYDKIIVMRKKNEVDVEKRFLNLRKSFEQSKQKGQKFIHEKLETEKTRAFQPNGKFENRIKYLVSNSSNPKFLGKEKRKVLSIYLSIQRTSKRWDSLLRNSKSFDLDKANKRKFTKYEKGSNANNKRAIVEGSVVWPLSFQIAKYS